MDNRMKLVLVTNMWNHHMAPLASRLLSLLGTGSFSMIVTAPVAEEYARLGYENPAVLPQYVIGPPTDEESRREIDRLCMEADVALMGYGPIKERIQSGKLTFVIGERLLRKPYYRLRMLNPRYATGIRRYIGMVDRSNAHALAVGQFAGEDLCKVGAFTNRIWSWGYFVEVNQAPPTQRVHEALRILWVGRMLRLKNINTFLRALRRIQDQAWFGDCRIVGQGQEYDSLRRLAVRLKLDPLRITFHPPVVADHVRQLMRESDVYVFPSGRREGWGAVVGEAMSEGCVVIANESAGSSNVLVKHRTTGLLFDDGDDRSLAGQLEYLGTHPEICRTLRYNGWMRMRDLWSPGVGAERIVKLSESLLNHDPLPSFMDGPCCKLG